MKNKEIKKDTVNHSFDSQLACIIGIEKAVICFTVDYWLRSNKEQKSKAHFKDGKWWTWLSRNTIAEKCPYLKVGSIGRWLIELENDKWISSYVFDEKETPAPKGTKAYTYGIAYEKYIEQTPVQSEQTPVQSEQLHIQNTIQNTNTVTNTKQDPDGLDGNDLHNTDNENPLPLEAEKKEKEKSCAKKENKYSHVHLSNEVFKNADNAKEFFEIWGIWIKYKKEDKKDMFKSETSEIIGIKTLLRLSNNNCKNALMIIENSIANGYKGLFELKLSQQQAQPKQETINLSDRTRYTVENARDF